MDATPQPVPDLPGTLPEGILEDRDGDGLPDYLNARIYVAAGASADELAAAANLAARLAFETLSLDLPIGHGIGDLTETDTTFAIVVGRAALDWCPDPVGWIETRQGSRRLLAIPSPETANRWATSAFAAVYENDEQEAGAGPGQASHERFRSLAGVFGSDGILVNSDVCLSLGPGVSAPEVIDLAARIALESSRLRLPMAIPWSEPDPDRVPLVVIGRSHPRARPAADPASSGEGRIELLSARPDSPVLQITGTDRESEGRALAYAAGSLPYIDAYGPGRSKLEDIEADLHDFVTLRSWPAQLAAGRVRARALKPVGDPDARLTLAVRDVVPRIRDRGRYAEGDSPQVRTIDPGRVPDGFDVADIGFLASKPIFEEVFTLSWEVDRARKLIETAVFPEIRPGSAVGAELRLSEPPEIRHALQVWIMRELTLRGADPAHTKVSVLSAHKQAYHWMTETLPERLRSASAITVEVRENSAPAPESIETPERWLQELYPVDEILARDLGLSPSDITLLQVPTGPTYRVTARDRRGSRVVDERFEPTFRERPLFSRFPDYGTSLVPTGWISVRVDGRVSLNERVRTDPEVFWDAFEERGLERLGRYLVGLHRGAPDPTLAPHFGTFEVEVTMSEPDGRIGVDEERISTVEALHEDIYFMTLLFIHLIGQSNRGCSLPYPGRIVPRVRAGPGSPPRVRISLTGKSRPGPALEIQNQGRTRCLELRPVPEVRPRIHRLTITSDPAVVDLGIRVDSPLQPNTVDRMLELGEMHREGSLPAYLAYPGVRRIDVEIYGESRLTEVSLHTVPNLRTADPAPRTDRDCSSIPQDRALDPEEAERHIARLSGRRGIRTFLAGHSFMGRPIWAQAVTAPLDGRYVSQSRLTISRPVLFLTGRQHGNEVSSTSHILKLLEWLVPEAADQIHPWLRRVSLIVLPVTNPDGAALAAELARESPGFMLHAGYYGCLGEDVIRDLWSPDSPYPEAHVRRRLWEIWRPDIVLDAHGYPSHEWVQLYGGYSGWFRSREHIRRDWWIPRGAFQPEPGETDVSSERLRTIATIRTAIDEALETAAGEVNRRMRDRYRKYVRTGPAPATRRRSFAQAAPDVTLAEAIIELPDETAEGQWLEMLIEAGLGASRACLEFLANAPLEVRRRRISGPGGTAFTVGRRRPLRAGDSDG